MKKFFLTLLFLVSFSAYSQKRFYPKKFNGNTDAIYITNSTSKNNLAFLYATTADTSKTIYLIENLRASEIEQVQDKLQLYNAKLCRDSYKTKVGDFIFSVTSESVFIYFYHAANANSTNEKIN